MAGNIRYFLDLLAAVQQVDITGMAEHIGVNLLPHPGPFAPLIDDLVDGFTSEGVDSHRDEDVVAVDLPGPSLQQPSVQVIVAGVVAEDDSLFVPLPYHGGPTFAQIEARDLQFD